MIRAYACFSLFHSSYLLADFKKKLGVRYAITNNRLDFEYGLPKWEILHSIPFRFLFHSIQWAVNSDDNPSDVGIIFVEISNWVIKWNLTATKCRQLWGPKTSEILGPVCCMGSTVYASPKLRVSSHDLTVNSTTLNFFSDFSSRDSCCR